MTFSRNKMMFFAAVFVALAVFNVVAFVIPFKREIAFWTGYGFTVAAIILSAGAGLCALGRKGIKSKFYGLPLAYMAWCYFIIQLIAGLLLMAVPAIPYQAGIVACTILLGAFLIGLIGADTGRAMIERVDKTVREKVQFIKSLHIDVENLSDKTTDETLKKRIRFLADSIRYSDPISSPQLAALESQIGAKALALAGSLSKTEAAAALCDELQMLIAERNRKCRALK